MTLTPGLGPVFIRRLLDGLGSASAALRASAAEINRASRCGPDRAARFVVEFEGAKALADDELALAAGLGVTIVARGAEGYSPLLAELPDAPPLLYVKGRLDAAEDRYAVAVVGSRKCSQYGIEQAARFGGVLAGAGLTVVSGGARGIDSAAHRGAVQAQGRTIAVLGCGLAECYPPENRELFDRIAAQGAVVSELPLRTSPKPENFPARNRIISGLSLGVLVIEAGERSGALITARLAAAEHGREVMVLPGRVDSPASRGSLALLKDGGGALVTDPGDVIQTLAAPGHHVHRGTHEARYAPADGPPGEGELFAPSAAGHGARERVLVALAEPKTIDELSVETGLDVGALRATLTMLEVQRAVVREGSRLRRSHK